MQLKSIGCHLLKNKFLHLSHGLLEELSGNVVRSIFLKSGMFFFILTEASFKDEHKCQLSEMMLDIFHMQ